MLKVADIKLFSDAERGFMLSSAFEPEMKQTLILNQLYDTEGVSYDLQPISFKSSEEMVESFYSTVNLGNFDLFLMLVKSFDLQREEGFPLSSDFWRLLPNIDWLLHWIMYAGMPSLEVYREAIEANLEAIYEQGRVIELLHDLSKLEGASSIFDLIVARFSPPAQYILKGIFFENMEDQFPMDLEEQSRAFEEIKSVIFESRSDYAEMILSTAPLVHFFTTRLPNLLPQPEVMTAIRLGEYLDFSDLLPVDDTAPNDHMTTETLHSLVASSPPNALLAALITLNWQKVAASYDPSTICRPFWDLDLECPMESISDLKDNPVLILQFWLRFDSYDELERMRKAIDSIEFSETAKAIQLVRFVEANITPTVSFWYAGKDIVAALFEIWIRNISIEEWNGLLSRCKFTEDTREFAQAMPSETGHRQALLDRLVG